jgi:hypothetical protein
MSWLWSTLGYTTEVKKENITMQDILMNDIKLSNTRICPKTKKVKHCIQRKQKHLLRRTRTKKNTN